MDCATVCLLTTAIGFMKAPDTQTCSYCIDTRSTYADCFDDVLECAYRDPESLIICMNVYENSGNLVHHSLRCLSYKQFYISDADIKQLGDSGMCKYQSTQKCDCQECRLPFTVAPNVTITTTETAPLKLKHPKSTKHHKHNEDMHHDHHQHNAQDNREKAPIAEMSAYKEEITASSVENQYLFVVYLLPATRVFCGLLYILFPLFPNFFCALLRPVVTQLETVRLGDDIPKPQVRYANIFRYLISDDVMFHTVWCFSWMIIICLPHFGSIECAEVVSTGEVRWQLANQASGSFLQAYYGNIDANGSFHRKCLTEWRVRINRRGAMQLQHSQSNKYVCFNRRRRIAFRIDGSSIRCYFYERISDTGFTELESAGEAGLYLGFNSRGRFQDPSTYPYKRKPFAWSKFERFVSYKDQTHCASKKKTHSKPSQKQTSHSVNFHQIMRENLLSKIRATQDGPYKNDNKTIF